MLLSGCAVCSGLYLVSDERGHARRVLYWASSIENGGDTGRSVNELDSLLVHAKCSSRAIFV